MKIKEKIRIIVKQYLGINDAGLDEDNLQNYGLDSLLFVKIIVDIELAFNIEFPDDKLILSEANTIAKIYDIVKPLVG